MARDESSAWPGMRALHGQGPLGSAGWVRLRGESRDRAEVRSDCCYNHYKQSYLGISGPALRDGSAPMRGALMQHGAALLRPGPQGRDLTPELTPDLTPDLTS